jgi:hypothetical protein
MSAARVWDLSEKGVVLLGIFQIGLGVASVAVAWSGPGYELFRRNSRRIGQLFESVGLVGGIAWLVVILVGVSGLVVGVSIFISLARSLRARKHAKVVEDLRGIGALSEASSSSLISIDAVDEEHAQQVASFLLEQEQQGRLVLETGRS